MFNMLYQYSQIASTKRAAQVWLPSDTAPTTQWFPWVGLYQVPVVSPEVARWQDDGGAP